MKKTMKETIESILEKEFDAPADTSWSVYDRKQEGGYFELSGHSPAGENIIITLQGETLGELCADALEAHNAFDPEEHAAEILIAKRTGDENARRFYATMPDSLLKLLEDAEAIEKIYHRVYLALRKALEEGGAAA